MSLLALPNELIVHIFKSVDNISSAASLSRTSRHLHEVWLYYLPPIRDTVLSRTIECYDQASQLVESMAKSDTAVDQSSVEEKAKAAVIRARLLFTNSDMADEALKYFEADLPTEWDEGFEQCTCTCNGTGIGDNGEPIVVGVSRTRFLRGYYQAMSIIYLAGKGSTRIYRFLASMDLLDFFRMVEAMEWIFFELGEEDMPDKDRALPGYDSRPRNPGEDADGEDDGPDYFEDIIKGYEFLRLLENHLAILSGIKRPITRWREPGLAYQLILHDHCGEKGSKKAQGIALAHLLPQLPSNIPFDPRYELSTLDAVLRLRQVRVNHFGT